MRRMAAVAAVIVVGWLVPANAEASVAASASSGATAKADFDGNGYSDLAIGVPDEDLGSLVDAGAVHVFYGGPQGLSSAGDQFWTQDKSNLDPFNGAELHDYFGAALAAGDFDGDGFADLAVGASSESITGVTGCGAVDVLYGSATGLKVKGDSFYTQSSPGLNGDGPEDFDGFGATLAAGDFGKGPKTDLAIGVPNEDIGTTSDAGAVNVLYGSSSGLTTAGDQFWHQNVAGVKGDGAEASDRFGTVLTAANFGKSTHADLAVGMPGEDLATFWADAGAVNVLYGSSTGLHTTGNQYWNQTEPTMAGNGAEPNEAFGWALAGGNFGRSRQADLAVGIHQYKIGSKTVGAVVVLYGTPSGLHAKGSQLWHQGRTGVAGDGAENGDQFGSALAAANFGHGPQADLAVGSPGETVGGRFQAGAVNVLFGSRTGLRAKDSQFWHQNKPGVVGDGAEPGDEFGWSLSAGNFGRTTTADLAVDSNQENIGAVVDAGAVNVLYGTSTGLNSAHSQFWHQNKPGVAGDGAQQDDYFGSRLAP